MNALSRLVSALGACLRPAGGIRTGRLIASRLDGLGTSKIRNSPTKAASIDLASGAPAFSTPQTLKDQAIGAIAADHNQYAHPNGDRELRLLIARSAQTVFGANIDADREVTVTAGTSAALAGCLLAVLEPGSEVIVFAPFFESYASAIRLAGGVPRYVDLSASGWTIDRNSLSRAFNKKTRALILNSPHNPTGRVFSQAELELVAQLCEQHNCVLLSDEIYSQLVYTGKPVSVLAVKANRGRNIIVDGLSKAYNATGWRVGYIIAPEELTNAFRVVHSILGLAAPTPLQIAARSAWKPSTLAELSSTVANCREARDILCAGLTEAGFRFYLPEGATYVFANASHLGASSDIAARDLLIDKTGISSVAGSCFLDEETTVNGQWLRFCFARQKTIVAEAAWRLEHMR